MTNKILIIGGHGFLGYNLAKKLRNLKYDVYCLCKKKNKKKFLKKIKYIYCNINNLKILSQKLKKDFDIVINFSGNIDHSNKSETYKTHFVGLKNIIKVLRKKNIKLFIQSGSSLEYGKFKSPHIEKKNCKPLSYYGKVKYLASRYLLKEKLNFKVVILRLYQIYGPHQKKDRLIPFVIDSSLKNKSFDCSDGKQKRDFLFVDDLNDLILKILKKKTIRSEIYNVGAGKPISVLMMINKISKIIGKGKPIFGGIKMRRDEISELFPNTRKVKKDFNWFPKTSISIGIKKTIKFYETNK